MDPKALIATTMALLVTALAFSTGAAALAPDEPNCMPVYQEYHLGPVTVIQYSSCNYEVRFNGTDPCGWEPATC